MNEGLMTAGSINTVDLCTQQIISDKTFNRNELLVHKSKVFIDPAVINPILLT